MVDNSQANDPLGFIVPYKFIPPTSGGERVCFNLAVSISKKMPISICSTKQSTTDSNLLIEPIIPSSVFKYFHPISFIRLYQWIRNRRIQVCIVNHAFLFLPTFVACRLNGASIIVYSHNLEHQRKDYKARRMRKFIFFLERLAYRLSDEIFFISQLELRNAIEIFKLTKSRCHFVPHIAHPTLLSCNSKAQADQTFSIVFFGNFSFGPNYLALRCLIEQIVPELESALEFDWKLTIFGKDAQSKSRKHLRHDSRHIEVLDLIPNIDIRLDHADLLLTPVSNSAGVQTKIIDALSSGLTVLSAKTGTHGLNKDAFGSKLITVPDTSWKDYASAVCSIYEQRLHLLPVPESFFDVYGESSVMRTVENVLQKLRSE